MEWDEDLRYRFRGQFLEQGDNKMMIYGDSGWDKKMSYRLIGRAFPQQRLVSFKITDAMQIENGRVLTEM